MFVGYVWDDVCLWDDVCGMWVASRQTAPKFGTHVRIDSLTLKKHFFTHPTPGGFRRLTIVKNLSRRTAPKFGTHVRI